MHTRSRTLVAALGGLLTIAGSAFPAGAQQFTSRTDLLSFLGSTAITETFDRPTAGGGQIVAVSAVSTLTTTTSVPGYGTGAIQPGIALANQNNGHWFFPANYGPWASPSGVYAGSHNTMDLTFTSPTKGFGLDLWVFANHPIGTTVSVFDVGGELIANRTLAAEWNQFFGWRHDAGIGRVRFSGGTQDALSVRIDDLTWGEGLATTPTTVPEPSTVVLMGAGLALVAALRRRTRAV